MWKRRVPKLVAAASIIALVWWLGAAYGFGRTAIGLLMGLAIVWLGLSYFRSVSEFPRDPEPEDISTSELRYVCRMCGLELKIEVATTDRAPTHCREPMALVRSGGRPPLRPVD